MRRQKMWPPSFDNLKRYCTRTGVLQEKQRATRNMRYTFVRDQAPGWKKFEWMKFKSLAFGRCPNVTTHLIGSVVAGLQLIWWFKEPSGQLITWANTFGCSPGFGADPSPLPCWCVVTLWVMLIMSRNCWYVAPPWRGHQCNGEVLLIYVCSMSPLNLHCWWSTC